MEWADVQQCQTICRLPGESMVTTFNHLVHYFKVLLLSTDCEY